jgi:predicted secreted Zn-dependent protease
LTPRDIADTSTITWRKASRSNAGNNCVEVASTPTSCLIRDSKNPSGPHLPLAKAAWTTFLSDIRTGKYDHDLVS